MRKRKWFYHAGVANGKGFPDCFLPSKEGKGNLISSLLPKEDGIPNVDGTLHSPVIDIDFEAVLIPSTTPGHYHLYLDGLTIEHNEYHKLLKALVKAGVMQQGNLNRFEKDGATFVRPPWVRKPENAEDSL